MKPKNNYIEIGVRALILNNKGQILILHRDKKKYGKALWGMPGGRLEFGETIRDGLKREVFEETGLNITKIDFLLGVQDVFYSEKQAVRITFVSREIRDKGIVISKEHVDYKYISINQLLGMKDVDPFLIKIIKDNKIKLMSFMRAFKK